MSATSWAAYDPTDAQYAYASAAYLYDSNVFRLSDNANTVAVLGQDKRSDMILTASAGGHAEIRPSRQVFALDLNVRAPFYNTYSDLNYVGWDGGAKWHGEIGKQFFGSASLTSAKTLSAFEDVAAALTDYATTNSGNAAFGAHITSNIDFQVHASESRVSHTDETWLDVKSQRAGSTLSYATDWGSTFGLDYEYTKVTYDNDTLLGQLLNTDYKEKTLGLSLHWPYSAKLSFDGNIGRLSVDQDNGGSATSWQGGADVNWQITGKTSVALTYAHSLDSPGATSGQSFTDHYGINGHYALSAKIKLRGFATYDKRKYPGSLNVGDFVENTRTFNVGLDWSPTTAIQTSLYGQYETRNSDIPGNTFGDHTIGANAKFWF
ncbi:outer membrane beta-barrel protein [Amantichitinum ursilacus]|uniref:Uncharacterized protein n=1 Tax=Amantichitinum ursilacus TaxID=857265 RepID=A0A0N1JSC8_9NEIS|nr:outer membrane beta-barrel protein [Amantichitinum ursilacus]KPC51813.1 hypothetical protein WG78_15120 [Amantichitinum ursilacus]